jgi:tetratricopeptide (TPR) repeat protein
MKKVTLFLLLSGLTAMAQTPAEISIAKASAEIEKDPKHLSYYNALAMAYAKRARETSDVSYYTRAEETLAKSFAISSKNFEGRKIEVWLLLGRHEFAKAREAAMKLNREVPDDVTVYGYLADANAELGNYEEALKAAQWMLDLRPGNIAGLTRGAYLRELFGDLPGAIELMQMAYDATSAGEREDQAWLLTQMAHLYLIQSDWKKAETYANGALQLFPNYHYALGTLGQIRMAQHRYTDAVMLFRQRYTAAPHAENLYDLAVALESSGATQESQDAFSRFEEASLAESEMADNSNHELILYYIDHANRPADALRMARAEMSRRHDVHTLDCYAWALAANGQSEQARAEIHKALEVGVKEGGILEHARRIAGAANDASAL